MGKLRNAYLDLLVFPSVQERERADLPSLSYSYFICFKVCREIKCIV